MFEQVKKLNVLCLLIITLSGCSGSTSNITDTETDATSCENSWASDGVSQSLRQENMAIIKSLLATNGGVYNLSEKLSNLENFPGQRSLQRLDCEWNVVLDYTLEDTQALIDFVEHPSGELSLIIIADGAYVLRRIDKNGALLAQILIENLTALSQSGDVADLSEDGEDILLAARGSDLSVKLYRYHYTPNAGFSYQWHTLVEPSTSAFGWIMHGGSYDTFEQLAQPLHISLAIDLAGNAYIAVPGLKALLFHHNEYFSENLESILHTDERVNDWPQLDAIVTKVSAAGERIYTVVAGSAYADEVYDLSFSNESIFIYGRSTQKKGYSWDAFITKLDANSGLIEFSSVLDIQNGDIIYDLIELDDGNLFAVGATNWTQNPVGFSVSEHSEKLALLLDGAGNIINRYDIPDGERHNQLRSVTSLDNDWLLISGFDDGPGTHSGDQDSSLVRADGFLTTLELP